MQELEDLLKKALGKRGLFGHAQAAQVTHIAHQWLLQELPDVIDRIHVSSVQDGVLTVKCDHSIVVQECHLLKNKLLNHLQTTISREVCTDIRFVRS